MTSIRPILRTGFIALFFSLGVSLTAGCQQTVPSDGRPSPSAVLSSTSATRVLPSATPLPAPSHTPIQTAFRATLTLTPVLPAPLPTQPDEQVYTDPEGWFALSLPVDWLPGDAPGSFFGKNGFLDVRFLPDLGFMTNILNVSAWQANIEFPEPENTTIWLDGSVTVDAGDGGKIQHLLFENPGAGYAHRFVRLTVDESHAEMVRSSFRWLSPAESLPRGARPPFHQMTLRPEDAALWSAAAPMPEGIAVTETVLTAPGQQVFPGSKPLTDLLPQDAAERRKDMIHTSGTRRLHTDELLAQFGYRLEQPPGGPQSLYKGDELLFDNVYRVDRAAVFPTESGEMLVFAVQTVGGETGNPDFRDYTVQGGEISERRSLFNDPAYPPVMVNGEVLWVRVDGTHVLVETSGQDILFDFSTYFGANVPLRQFKSWNDHWILEIADFIIQDGEIINEKYDFQETFDWHPLNGKPFFFFRKGKRVGIFYNGGILPIYYHDVIRGFG